MAALPAPPTLVIDESEKGWMVPQTDVDDVGRVGRGVVDNDVTGVGDFGDVGDVGRG